MKALNLPFAIDHANKNRPSMTVLFAWVSFLAALCACIYLAVKDPLSGAISAIVLHTVSMVLYRMRQVDKLSITRQGVDIEDTNPPSK